MLSLSEWIHRNGWEISKLLLLDLITIATRTAFFKKLRSFLLFYLAYPYLSPFTIHTLYVPTSYFITVPYIHTAELCKVLRVPTFTYGPKLSTLATQARYLCSPALITLTVYVSRLFHSRESLRRIGKIWLPRSSGNSCDHHLRLGARLYIQGADVKQLGGHGKSAISPTLCTNIRTCKICLKNTHWDCM